MYELVTVLFASVISKVEDSNIVAASFNTNYGASDRNVSAKNMQIGVNVTTADVCCYDDVSVELSLKAVPVFQVIFKLTPGLRRLRSQLE